MAETETFASRDRDETETRRWYVWRPCRDRDVETEVTTLPGGQMCTHSYYISAECAAHRDIKEDIRTMKL